MESLKATSQSFPSFSYLGYLLWTAMMDKISSVIRQKSKSQNGCFNKKKHAKFSEKRTFLTPWYINVHIRGVRNIRFSENLACFVFLKHSFWDSPFCLITDALIKGIAHLNLKLPASRIHKVVDKERRQYKVPLKNTAYIFSRQ